MSMILTLTGMSTSGKSTLAKALTSTGVFAEAVSVTTRPMRAGEVDGKDYHFVTQDKFDKYVEDGQLLEHVRSHHACYGVPAFEVDRIKAAGQSVVMVLEPEGVSSIHQIALCNNEDFLAAFVHVDMKVLLERFFIRIDDTVAAGKPVNFEQEAKRMHVMLSQERSWIGRYQWDMTLMNLHLDGNLANAVESFIDFHGRANQFKAVARTLKPAMAIECIPVEGLKDMIESQVAHRHDLKDFLKSALSPMIEIQRKIRYHGEEAPTMSI